MKVSPDDRDPMQFRGDIWAHEFCRALCTTGHSFREPGHAATPIPQELKHKKGFEVSQLHRVALWHSGFVEASSRLDNIARWLDGGQDEDLS